MRPLVLIIAGLLACAAASADDRKDEKRRKERFEELSQKLARRLREPRPAPESVFFHERAAGLLKNAKAAQADEYRFDRLCRAADALLEASERIFDSRERENDDEADDQRDAARKLERRYFRVKQADYFAQQAGAHENEYLRYVRRLYQQARSAYDLRQYRTASLLGEAAVLTVDALERLAQAAVRIPDPPRLK